MSFPSIISSHEFVSNLLSVRFSLNSTQKDWSILKAGWRNYPQLNDLEKACFISEDRWPFWDTLGVLTLPGLVRLKAVSGDRMVGFVGGERNHALHRGWVTTPWGSARLSLAGDCQSAAIRMRGRIVHAGCPPVCSGIKPGGHPLV